jgi:hypothetical protein
MRNTQAEENMILRPSDGIKTVFFFTNRRTPIYLRVLSCL